MTILILISSIFFYFGFFILVVHVSLYRICPLFDLRISKKLCASSFPSPLPLLFAFSFAFGVMFCAILMVCMHSCFTLFFLLHCFCGSFSRVVQSGIWAILRFYIVYTYCQCHTRGLLGNININIWCLVDEMFTEGEICVNVNKTEWGSGIDIVITFFFPLMFGCLTWIADMERR